MKLSKDGRTVETSLPREIVSLRAQGYTEATAPKRAAAEPKTVEPDKAESPKPSK